MEKHGNVSIDFINLGGGVYDLKIPLHISVKHLIEELVTIFNLEAVQEEKQLHSIKAIISKQYISSNQSLLDANIKDGEYLVIIK